MKTKHTSGDWYQGYGNNIYVGGHKYDEHSNRRLLATCWPTTKTQEDWDEVFANTRLIAAAPELLEALKYCRNKIAYMQAHGEWYSPGRAIEMADAAIAKATGEQA